MSGELTVIYWRDIPAQVIAREGRDRHKAVLPDRFQQAIDRAAMIAGLEGTDEYLAQWRRDTRPCDGDIAEAVAAETRRLEQQFGEDEMRRLVEGGGAA